MVVGVKLGFAVKVLGEPLKEADLRRAASGPSLAQSLTYLGEIFDYLERRNLGMYRMSSDLAKYMTHPDYPEFHDQLPQNAERLSELGGRARRAGLRVSFHPSQYILLNSPSDDVTARSIADLDWQARVLDMMGLGPEAVVVLHLGGEYGEHDSARARFVERFERLNESIRRRLVIENDDVSFSVADCLWVHERTGLRIVFDNLHHAAVNPEGMAEGEALRACLGTWPEGQKPKIHFASPATQFQLIEKREGKKKRVEQRAPSRWTSHSDFVDPFAFLRFLEHRPGRDFDVMLEAKAKDLAAIALRDFLRKRGVEVE